VLACYEGTACLAIKCLDTAICRLDSAEAHQALMKQLDECYWEPSCQMTRAEYLYFISYGNVNKLPPGSTWEEYPAYDE
jgi:hypothetical protein